MYIDPRNLEEFYYGKGKGSRKNAHLLDVSDSEKSRRIGNIKEAGLEPTIRVIAATLTEQEALLIEATLIWKLGRFTANVAGGHFASKFRRHDTYHMELSGFDFQNGIYYYNVGENGLGSATANRGQAACSTSRSHRGFLPRHLGNSAGGTGKVSISSIDQR